MSSNFPWPSWIKPSPPPQPPPDDKKRGIDDDITKFVADTKARLDVLPPSLLALTAFALGSTAVVAGAMVYIRYGRRIKSGDWLTPDVLAKKRWIKGVVTSVGDADNFRLYHTPPLGGYHWPFKFRRIPSLAKDLKDQTLHIRIAGVDAPEAAHFGRPAQPYSEESLAWLRKKILGKTVYCQVIRRDQYSRIVSYVQLSPRILPGSVAHGKSLALEMLKSGWVVTYVQAGAEYGKLDKSAYLKIEEEAKAARRGMWEHGTEGETPAEYKRRYAQSATGSEAPKAPERKKVGWWRRLWSRGK